MFVLELSTQCQFAKECYRRLCNAAPACCRHATHKQLATRVAPRDIMIDCSAFLAAAAVISKLLFSGRRTNKKVVRRCERLRALLNLSDHDLPILRNLSVRNSFEHVDERLVARKSDCLSVHVSRRTTTCRLAHRSNQSSPGGRPRRDVRDGSDTKHRKFDRSSVRNGGNSIISCIRTASAVASACGPAKVTPSSRTNNWR